MPVLQATMTPITTVALLSALRKDSRPSACEPGFASAWALRCWRHARHPQPWPRWISTAKAVSAARTGDAMFDLLAQPGGAAFGTPCRKNKQSNNQSPCVWTAPRQAAYASGALPTVRQRTHRYLNSLAVAACAFAVAQIGLPRQRRIPVSSSNRTENHEN